MSFFTSLSISFIWPFPYLVFDCVCFVCLMAEYGLTYREGVEVLLTDLQVAQEEYSYGRSKIFIRNPRTVSGRPFTMTRPPVHVQYQSKAWTQVFSLLLLFSTL